MACNAGHNEASFMKTLFGCRQTDAYRLIPHFKSMDDKAMWTRTRSEIPIPLAHEFNISPDIQNSLQIVTTSGNDLVYPVFMYDKLLDTRTYDPTQQPKVRSRRGAVAGLILPFDIWQREPHSRWTILAAGEKDMSVTRTKGLNAITLTGGEQTLPVTPKFFAGRKIAICYDNDDTGIRAGIRLANYLAKHGAIVKLVTLFHEGMENKEDLTDYFNKYGKTREDLINCIELTPIFEPTEDDSVPLITLHQAALPQYTNQIVSANIQVVAVADATFTMPSELVGTKTRQSGDDKGDTMATNDSEVWAVDEDNMQSVLHLVDNNFKEKQIRENQLKLLGIPMTERNISIKTYGRHTVYKATVTDMFETASKSDHMPMEFLVYSIGHRLESGKKYTATFKIVPHPYQGQQLVMVLWSVQQASDSVTSFKITPAVKASLDVFKGLTERVGVAEAMQECTERIKGLLGYNGNNTLIETLDLAYHTPLEFSLGRFSKMRAYLDTIVVGESRMGKSSTAETMRKAYGLGTFVSLAGNSATIPGLVGGSNKTGTGYQTKAGLIPQNHKGLMIFEEFGKCKADVISELTDIRSSNEVRITRVSGTLTLPAMVRMITLSNVKTLPGKDIRSIASYPNGISVIIELVGSAEDIARYDIMLVLGDKGTTLSDPYWQPLEPFAEEDYFARIRWVWSRTAEQIVISEEVGHYIFQQANALNGLYDSHIKIFGTEGWKKLARVAIAIAGYTVSTEDYENIIVKQEHVDYAVNYMTRIYDNPVFKLKQYVEHERKYNSTDAQATAALQEIFLQASGAVLHLDQETKTSRQMLMAASGLTNDQTTQIMNRLLSGMFIKLSGNDIMPTERFRLTASTINRHIIRRIGEPNGA